MEKSKIVLDCFGDICPIPILKIEKALAKIKLDENIMIITDHSCVARSIEDKYNKNGFEVSTEEPMNGVWEITISKKY